MSSRSRFQRLVCGVLTAVVTSTSGPLWAAGPIANPFRQRTSIETLAKRIDELEKALQYHGRITAKAPDIWGQARLTQHRQEFENQMKDQLKAFEPVISAERFTSDQAFLLQAMALNAALNGEAKPQPDNTTFNSLIATSTVGNTATEAGTPTAAIQVRRTSPFDNLGPDSKGRTLFPPDFEFGLEPEILLDQRKRFLDHLHEIRRVNEGDDTSDLPGYSLNLVRIPVSIQPGDRTREGYAAEITVTAESHVTEELLPTTFRSLVINDLIDLLALPVVQIVERTWDKQEQLSTARGKLAILLQEQRDLNALKKSIEKLPNDNSTVPKSLVQSRPSVMRLFGPNELNRVDKQGALNRVKNQLDVTTKLRDDAESQEKELEHEINTLLLETSHGVTVPTPRSRRARYAIAATRIHDVIGGRQLAEIAQDAFRSRDLHRCRNGLQLADVQGFLRNELEHAYDFLWSSAGNLQAIPSADQILNRSEIGTERGRFFTNLPSHAEQASRLSGRDKSIRQVDYSLPALPAPEGSPAPGLLPVSVAVDRHDPIADRGTEALAWAILVESSLLNAQLNEDLRRVSRDPNCQCLAQGWHEFYRKDPSAEARQAFVEYVKCRWPIRVFAVDPVAQQQNVSDAFGMRREAQLAIALAFNSGRVGAQSLTRYVRRIEQDLRTIELNNTVVGFGAGDSTFGWRFFPRVQTPDIESNATVFWRDLVWGGPSKDARIRKYRMEPRMTECTAIVLMPSFISHVRFDVRSDWFKMVPNCLTHRGAIRASMEDTVGWSKQVRSVEDGAMACVADEHLYRHGEVERMVKRVQQLSQQIPLATMYSAVPYENNLGGFEMFTAGTADLAPELVGFYGAPGVDRSAPTRVFLVGDNFSVQNSRVIAGNTEVEPRLLSREVMEVEIPAGARIEKRLCEPREDGADGAKIEPCKDSSCIDTKGCCDEYVEIRLATPYGVSSPLLVPVVAPTNVPAVAPPALQWSRPAYRLRYMFTPGTATTTFDVGPDDVLAQPPHRFEIAIPPNLVLPPGNSKMSLTVESLEYNVKGLTEINDVPRNASGTAIVIDSARFSNLQDDIRQKILPSLKARFGATPQGPVNLTLRGSAIIGTTTFPVEDGVLLTIEFAKK